MLAASTAFAVMGTLVKVVSAVVPTGEIVAWRCLITAAFVLALAWGDRAALRPRNLGGHALRGLSGVVSMYCYFVAIDRLPLGDAVLLTYLSPLMVGVLSPWTVGERPSRRTWVGLGIGVGGVALVVGPAWGALDPVGVAAGLASSLFAAGAYLSVRRLTRTDGPLAIVWWFSVIGAIVASTSFLDGAVVPGWRAGLALVTVGGLGTVAQWCMTRAYALSEAARVAVYAYATPVLAYGLGLAALGEVPRPESLVGVGVVALAGWIARA